MIGEELLSVERREVVALKPKGRWFKSNDPLVLKVAPFGFKRTEVLVKVLYVS
jgi:hypothetical protein